MPCYLFTWHAYGSWLPDRPQGHVHWSRGREAQNPLLAVRYRQQQKQTKVRFRAEQQREIIEELLNSANPLNCRIHFATADASHIHLLVSWSDNRSYDRLRRSLRRSISLRLNRREQRHWLSRGGTSRGVRDRRHYDHLAGTYLPSHDGTKWSELRGWDP